MVLPPTSKNSMHISMDKASGTLGSNGLVLTQTISQLDSQLENSKENTLQKDRFIKPSSNIVTLQELKESMNNHLKQCE